MANTHTTLTSLFTAIADKIRTKTGSTETIVADNFPDAIDGIVTLNEGTADGTAVAGDILSGKTAYVDGEKITGTIPTKTADDLTADFTTSTQFTFTAPAGYYASDAIKNIPTINVTSPTITINASGLITARAEQSKGGYVREGYISKATKQLTTQAAKTITPTTSSQTAVAKGRYTTGTVTVNAVPTQTKSATPSTSAQTISPDSGKFLSSVTVDAIPSNYITTSDATATASDMASGVTAYVNGSKVTGNLPTVSSGGIIPNASILQVDTSNNIQMTYTLTDGRVFKPSTFMGCQRPASDFGDATASDVAAGKTFTSSAGLKVTGTGSSKAIANIVSYYIDGTDEYKYFHISLDKPLQNIESIYFTMMDTEATGSIIPSETYYDDDVETYIETIVYTDNIRYASTADFLGKESSGTAITDISQPSNSIVTFTFADRNFMSEYSPNGYYGTRKFHGYAIGDAANINSYYMKNIVSNNKNTLSGCGDNAFYCMTGNSKYLLGRFYFNFVNSATVSFNFNMDGLSGTEYIVVGNLNQSLSDDRYIDDSYYYYQEITSDTSKTLSYTIPAGENYVDVKICKDSLSGYLSNNEIISITI